MIGISLTQIGRLHKERGVRRRESTAKRDCRYDAIIGLRLSFLTPGGGEFVAVVNHFP